MTCTDSGVPPAGSPVWRKRSRWLIGLLALGPRTMPEILRQAKRELVAHARELVAWSEIEGEVWHDGTYWHLRKTGPCGGATAPRNGRELPDDRWPTHQGGAVMGPYSGRMA